MKIVKIDCLKITSDSKKRENQEDRSTGLSGNKDKENTEDKTNEKEEEEEEDRMRKTGTLKKKVWKVYSARLKSFPISLSF